MSTNCDTPRTLSITKTYSGGKSSVSLFLVREKAFLPLQTPLAFLSLLRWREGGGTYSTGIRSSGEKTENTITRQRREGNKVLGKTLTEITHLDWVPW